MTALQTFSVDEAGELEPFLFQVLAEVKRTKIRNLLRFGAIAVNGAAVTRHDHRLRLGDSVSVALGKQSPRKIRMRPGLKIVYEDAAILVAYKPHGLLTVATATEHTDTAYHGLNEYVKAQSPEGRGRIYLVHRLDRETSGLLLFAKSENIRRELKENWKGVEKQYLAIVEGTPRKASGTIYSHLHEDASLRMVSGPQSGVSKHAVTRYRVTSSTRHYALLEVTLDTGRKNQVRVHCADMGHPVVGDEKYGSTTNPAKRLALHAHILAFEHPVTRKPLRFVSPLPQELRKVLDRDR